ncbi:voltage-dependent calcium channel subunit alpha-2/delta-3-like isoform X3 [Macrosteles quadrilineatus]|uniref:voltage-dependent calcium channel subunit alpha-2/delta-3-like isoform X3 n=1 Tax=Macrosteles quadrilineatus TaxID=74068 RepID=UPI0023E1C72F|nr:voltage-dependent calcium channel subunit alpha-2/delta-3-like isoform X3 [Macrosteles quadrilineatus]XP_054290665.1 voltage-dependent calcium channel subunit alpha-2/delta-3-like isoform X3 [Macrosteles quadrilineatus]
MRTNFCYTVVLGQLLFVSFTQQQDSRDKEEIKPQIVEGWAGRLAGELWNLGDYVTRRDDVRKSFKDAKVESREGSRIVSELVREMENMMSHKVEAVKRIVDTAENAAVDSNPDEPVPNSYEYYSAKLLRPPGQLNLSGDDPKGTRELLLTPDTHFYDFPVNTNVSSVHVPTNVYDRAQEVIYAIKWSERLELTFKDNYKRDPSLSWQYFGSSTGFMRQFPATGWSVDPVDLYDCRTRAWYIEAATSPKDVLILVDNSGSMMGQRKEIARHVVNSILDTLGNNDFVNIMSFVNDTKEVVECYKDMLVQANLENIRELKMGMREMGNAQYIANFSTALTTAFDILQQYRENRMGAACNQAIMLITDGVPYNYKEIFELYNWRNLPYMPVRVFTYLLGKEVADVREVKWMACANRGYYVHLSTLAEVREQVLQYVPVMARPMVLHRDIHPVIWTSVYADITDPSMTDYLWEQEECKEQKQRSMNFRKDRQRFMEPDEQERRNIKKLRRIQDQAPGDTKKYRFMTSVSMPVFDRRETANVKIGRDCSEHDPTCPKPTQMKVAYLLGVAGTDIPIEEINSLLAPHWLGVNAYAFIVTNNGYILVHPDWRPVFQGILKPNYNAIDMTDVELMDDGRDPLDFNEKLLEFRRKLVRGNTTGSISLPMKQHLDGLRRVMRGMRYYYYKPIQERPGKYPLTLVVSLPEHYGRYQVDGIVETHLLKQSKGKLNFFEGKNWKVHPDWFYCRYRMDTEETPTFNSPEEEVEHFFAKTQSAGWNWPPRYPPEPFLSNASVPTKSDKPGTKIKPYFCDRTLFLSLVFDAKVTAWFNKNVSAASAEDKGKEFKQRFGLTLVFLATRSGLTRWQDFPDVPGKDDQPSGPHFKDTHVRAIDEVWYRRAVEQNYDDPDRFIYTVPFNSGILGSENLIKNEILVTAANAIFAENGDKRAPAAVVGFQFQHSALHNLFMNITRSCPTSMGDCRHSQTCASDSFECFVLDSNAYVILSENKEHTGYFFGEIHPFVMEQLVAENVYRRVHIYDYQGVCFATQPEKSDSVGLKNPLHYISWLGNWIVANVVWFLFEFNFQWIGTLGFSFPPEVSDEEYITEGEEEEGDDVEPTMSMPSGESNIKDVFGKVMINRTRPAPCTMEVDLYQLVSERERAKSERERERGRASRGQPKERDVCSPPFVVQSIPSSDLMLLVVNANCPTHSSVFSMNVIPSEVNYNGTTLNCQKIKFKHNMDRRRPPSCIKEHEKEEDIKLCGRGGRLTSNNSLEWLCLIVLYLITLALKSS